MDVIIAPCITLKGEVLKKDNFITEAFFIIGQFQKPVFLLFLTGF